MSESYPHSHLQKEVTLAEALSSMYQSSLVIYNEFQIVFKLMGLILLAYLSFKVGKKTVSEPIADKITKISKSLLRVEKERGDIPKRITEISKTYTKLIVLCILALVFIGFAKYLEQIQIKVEFLAYGVVIPFILYVYMSIKVSFLTGRMKKLPEEEKKIRENTSELIQMLGKKVQNNLKTTLCRDKFLTKTSLPANVCNKQDCQSLRGVLRQRYESIRVLAESALVFDWCSTCKKKNIFDELLHFESKEMENKQQKSQEEEVEYRLRFLLQNMEDMLKWLNEASPCNCSKLYMEEIIKNKKQFNHVKKQSNAKLRLLDKTDKK